MRFNIISFEKEDSNLLNSRKMFNKLICNDSAKKDKIEKYYYSINSNIIEYSYFNKFYKNDILKEVTNKSKEKKIIFLLRKFNEESIKIIKEVNKYNKNNIVIIDNKDTFEDDRSIFIINNFGNVLYLPQLKNLNNDELKINLLLKFINVFLDFKSKEEMGLTIKESIVMCGYVGKKNMTKDIVMSILENFQLIQCEGDFYLNIYNSNMNLQELSYIEDPLKEYMHYNSNLIIKQLTNKTSNDRIFFSLIYNK